MAEANMVPVELPDENLVRLQAWANAARAGTFCDPVEPDALAWRTIGLAVQSLAQEVLLLRAHVRALEHRDG